jgi:hypothetical protein
MHHVADYYLQQTKPEVSFTTPTILNDNVNQFKIGLELDKGYFTLKAKIMTLMSRNSIG